MESAPPTDSRQLRNVPGTTLIVEISASATAARTRPEPRILRLPRLGGAEGSLVWGEWETQLPFSPLRFWCVRDVPRGGRRGNHAHRSLHEILVCVQGSCVVDVDDGASVRAFTLAAPDVALYLPPLFWSTQREFSPDAALLVLADQRYQPEDYIRDYDEFRTLVARER